jgi:hypothetical protein
MDTRPTMTTSRWRLLLALVMAQVIIATACILPCLSGSRMVPTPAPTVPVSDEAARGFAEKTDALGKSGDFQLEVTDEEVTSYIALSLNDEVPIAQPQVRFLPGQFVLDGELTRPLRGHIHLTGTVSLADGRPELEFDSASLGGLSLPRSLLTSLSDSFLETAGIDNSKVQLQSIELDAGRVIVTGRMVGP